TKDELKARYEEARDEASKLKKRLLDHILSLPEFSVDRMLQAHRVIDAIDPAIGRTTEAFTSLLQQWHRQLPSSNDLLTLLELFESVCDRVQTYKFLYEHYIPVQPNA